MNSKAPIPKFSILQRITLSRLGISNWNIPTHVTSRELLKLYELTKSMDGLSVAVEIGSYIGASSLMIAKGLNADSELYCVDTWENDAMTEGNWDTFVEFKKNTELVANKIVMVRSNSADAAKKFEDTIDFLFLDGDHSYEGVKKDVDAWLEKLKSGGIITMHDIGWAEGVKKVVKEDVKPHLERFKQLPNLFWGWKK